MCLKIITHAIICDVRLIIPHLSRLNSYIIGPLSAPQDSQNPAIVLVAPRTNVARLPSAHFRATAAILSDIIATHLQKRRLRSQERPQKFQPRGSSVSYKALNLDDIPCPEAHAHPALSEELRIARRGCKYAVERLGRMAAEFIAASRKKDLKEQNLKNGAPYEQEVEAAHDELYY
ncbi:hypothetical protein F5Y12DRAFT_716281 [Xylaria sp. FL1777]|nr:hypothetical protein F5Y12DRAFT_716281 [Xylaria sp. FL1777]